MSTTAAASSNPVAGGPGMVPGDGTSSDQRREPGIGWYLSLVLTDRRAFGRALLMAIGIGLCTLVLLALAAVAPSIDRIAARSAAIAPVPGSGDFSYTAVSFGAGDDVVRGLLLSGTTDAPPPPGTTTFPPAGHTLVSPALAAALASPDSATVRAQLPGQVTGTIDPEFLAGPNDLFFYAGTAETNGFPDTTTGISWGRPTPENGLPQGIWAILLAGTAVLTVPLLLLVTLAARLGAGRRDRRTAVLRLLGASRHHLRRLAAVESLLGTAIGVLLAAGVFAALREFAGRVQLAGVGINPRDLAPSPIGGLLVLLVVGILAAGSAIRASDRTIERPLTGSSGGGPVRRRMAWRWGLLALTMAAGWFAEAFSGGSISGDNLAAVGPMCVVIVLSLLCIAAFAGPVITVINRRWQHRSVAWQLAGRRIVFDDRRLTRPAGALATVLGGTIVLASLLTATPYVEQQADLERPVTSWGNLQLDSADEWEHLDAALTDLPGVRSAVVVTMVSVSTDNRVSVAACSTVRLLDPAVSCRNGDSFHLVQPAGSGQQLSNERVVGVPDWTPPPGTRVLRVTPDLASIGFVGVNVSEYLLTPGAAEKLRPGVLSEANQADVRISVRSTDDLDHLRQAVSWLGPRAYSMFWSTSTDDSDDPAPWALGALIGAGLLTVLICLLAQLVAAAEQLAERRRTVAPARASGVPVRTLRRSVLLTMLIPAAVGVLLAVGTGIALIGYLGRVYPDAVAGVPWGWVGWGSLIALTATALAAAVSAWQLTRRTGPAALRTE